jgi:hypothetical protein
MLMLVLLLVLYHWTVGYHLVWVNRNCETVRLRSECVCVCVCVCARACARACVLVRGTFLGSSRWEVKSE